MTITGRITSLAARTLRAAARAALRLADRLDGRAPHRGAHADAEPVVADVGREPTVMAEPRSEPIPAPDPGTSRGQVRIDPLQAKRERSLDDADGSIRRNPMNDSEVGPRWLVSETEAPVFMQLVQPEELPPHGGAAVPGDEDDELEDGGSPDERNMAVYPDHSGTRFVRAHQEGEIVRAYRLADEALAGRSIADVMREATMPWAEVVKVMRGEPLSPVPRSTPIPTPGHEVSGVQVDIAPPIAAPPSPPAFRTPVESAAPAPTTRPRLDDAQRREFEIMRAVRVAADSNMTGHTTARQRLLDLRLTDDEIERRIAAKIEERRVITERAEAAYARQFGR